MAEVQAELEELEASSSPRFNNINTPDFGADALKATLNGQPVPCKHRQPIFQILLDFAEIVDKLILSFHLLDW
eukprot:5069047-Amphidinium_carterae.1